MTDKILDKHFKKASQLTIEKLHEMGIYTKADLRRAIKKRGIPNDRQDV